MRKRIHSLFNELENNESNYVSFYQNERKVKSFKELSNDINIYIAKLDTLNKDNSIKNVAILGPTSYEWMLLDLACIKGGYRSVAIPETLSKEKVQEIVYQTDCSILLLDASLKAKFFDMELTTFYFRCNEKELLNNWDNVAYDNTLLSSNKQCRILEYYGIAFSSGTSENIKTINLRFADKSENKKKGIIQKIKEIKMLIEFKRSFWSRKDNKILVFMPFSHVQQRSFVIQCLQRGINIALSDPLNCFQHLIIEKPNILVSVPIFYETLAKQIQRRLDNFSSFQKYVLWIFNFMGINTFKNRNLLKIFFTKALFKDIKKIYGGKADYFVTGSAPINPEVLKIFYKIGVKIFEGYGQSESAIIAINTEKNFRIGSVGKPLVDIKLSDEGEILLKYDETKYGHNNSILKRYNNEYIHTGDYGYLDKDGFLFLKGRLDDVIVLSNGKKIFPLEIERKIEQWEMVDHAILFLKENSLSLIISLKIQKGKTSWDPIILNERIKEINKNLYDFEKIKSYLLVNESFSQENGLLTSNFKVRRKAVIKKYGPQINYQEILSLKTIEEILP